MRTDQPLGLPPGSVRSLIALGLLFGLTGTLLLLGRDIPEELWVMDSMAAAWYFATAPERKDGGGHGV